MPKLRSSLSPATQTRDMQVVDSADTFDTPRSARSKQYSVLSPGGIKRRLSSSMSVTLSETSSEESKDDIPEERLQLYRKVVRDVTHMCSRNFVLPRDSLYGSAMVLPQVARSLECHSLYVGKCVVHWVGLFFAQVMQVMLVIQVHSLLQHQDYECEHDPCDCLQKGFRPLQADTLQYLRWNNVTNINIGAQYSISGKKWFLCLAAEGGSHYHILRKLCVMAFVIALFKDLRQSAEMVRFLFNVPTEAGHWMTVITNVEDSLHVRANGRKQVVRRKHPSMMWQVAPLERNWKLAYFLFLLVPKVVIFFCVYWEGCVWLMSEVERSELILNAVALVFVLDLDELLFSAIATSDVQQYMDNLQPWSPSQDGDTGTSSDDEDAEKAVDVEVALRPSGPIESGVARGQKWILCGLNVLVFPMVLVLAMVIIQTTYESHCSGYAAEHLAHINKACNK